MKKPLPQGHKTIHTTDLEPTPSLLSRHKDKLIMAGLGLTVLTLFSTLIFRSSALTNQFIPLSLTSSTNTTGSVQPVPDATAAGGSYLKFVSTGGGGGPAGKRGIIGLHGAGGNGSLIGGFGSCGDYPIAEGVLTLAAPLSAMPYDNVGAMANYLNQLADENGLEQIILHGFSMGGAAVHRLAAAHETLNGRVVGYIIDDPAGSGVSGNPGRAAGTQAVVYYNDPGPTVGYSQAMANEIGAEWKENVYYDHHHPITRQSIKQGCEQHAPNGGGEGPLSAPEEAADSSWWRSGSSSPNPPVTPPATPPADPPTSGGPTGKRCVLGLPGSGGNDNVQWGGTFGSAASYDSGDFTTIGSNNNEGVESLRSRVDAAGCGQIIAHGFSLGGGSVTSIYCAGETFGGRLLGVIIDDPAYDGEGSCARPAGVKVKLYGCRMGGRWSVDVIQESYLTQVYGYTDFMARTEARLGVTAEVSPCGGQSHYPYVNPPEISGSNAWWN